MNTLTMALNSARASSSRFAFTVLAVALSVAFLTATLVLSDSIAGTAPDDIAAAHQDIDYVVEGAVISSGEGGPGDAPESVKAELAMDVPSDILEATTIQNAVGIDEGFAKLVDDGVAIGDSSVLDVGRAWVDDPRLNTFELKAGSAPRESDEVVIDAATARQASLSVGDPIQVITATGLHEMSISGIATYGGADRAPLQRTSLFAPEIAIDLMEIDGFNEVFVRSEADLASVQSVVRAIDPTAVVVTNDHVVAERQLTVTSPLSFLTVFLFVFAGLATIVGITIINNTFSIAMAQRKNELATLRAIGASQPTVLRLVMSESAVIAISATAVGLAAGLLGVRAIRGVLTTLGIPAIDGPTIITPSAIIIASAVGMLVTLVSAWFPARAAARTSPIEAMRTSATEPRSLSRKRSLVGVALLGLGGISLMWAARQNQSLPLIGGGLLAPGLILAGPMLVAGPTRFSSQRLVAFLGAQRSVAISNISLNPRRSSSTTLGLTVGVAMVGFFAIIASSLSASLASGLDERVGADQVVASVAPQYSTIESALSDRIAELPSTQSVGALTIVEVGLDGGEAVVGGVDPDFSYDFAGVDKPVPALGDAEVAVWTGGESPAPDIGEELTLSFPGGDHRFTVVAQFEESLSGFDPPTHLIGGDVLTEIEPGLLDTVLFVELTDGATAVDDLRDAVAATPGALLQTPSEYVASASTGVDSIRNLVFAMLGLTVIIAIVGVANTTALSVSERTREIGLLRAIGATPSDVRQIVRWEAAVLTVLGTALGMLVAVATASALIEALDGGDLNGVSLPMGQLVIITAGAIVAGVASAAWPGWRASVRPTLSSLAS